MKKDCIISLCAQFFGQQFQHRIAESFPFLRECLSHIFCVDVEWSYDDVAWNKPLQDFFLMQMHFYFLFHFDSTVILTFVLSVKDKS